MISIALPISFWMRELRYQDRTEELPLEFLYINLPQFCQILSQIQVSHRNNNKRSPYTQHVKHNAKE